MEAWAALHRGCCRIYEWHLRVDGQKRPYFIQISDQEVFDIAGLWDRSFSADRTAIESCVHITMPANPLVKDIHNTGKNPHRMPAILRKAQHEAWLAFARRVENWRFTPPLPLLFTCGKIAAIACLTEDSVWSTLGTL